MSNKIIIYPCGTCKNTVFKHDLRNDTYNVPRKTLKVIDGELAAWCGTCQKFVGIGVNPLSVGLKR